MHLVHPRLRKVNNTEGKFSAQLEVGTLATGSNGSVWPKLPITFTYTRYINPLQVLYLDNCWIWVSGVLPVVFACCSFNYWFSRPSQAYVWIDIALNTSGYHSEGLQPLYPSWRSSPKCCPCCRNTDELRPFDPMTSTNHASRPWPLSV